MEYEMLRCEHCNYSFERQVQRGRKPRLCEFCRMDGVKLRPKAPITRPASNPGRAVVGSLVISDGGKSEAGYGFERNDCTVRAIAVACEAPYAQAYTFMARNGRRKNKGAFFHSIIARNSNAVLGKSLTPIAVNPAKGIRVFLQRNPQMRKGTFVIHMTRHVAVLRNGQLVDSFDSSRKVINGAWLVSSV